MGNALGNMPGLALQLLEHRECAGCAAWPVLLLQERAAYVKRLATQLLFYGADAEEGLRVRPAGIWL